MAEVAVGKDLEDGRLGFLVGALERDGRLGADFVDVVAVDDVPGHVVAFGALREAARVGGRAFLGSAHRVAVVLDDEDDREVPEGGQVVGFMDRALVDGAVTHVDEAATLQSHVFDGVGEAGAEGGLAPDDAVAAPVVLIRGEVVHRAALTLGAAGDAAGQFGHAFVHAHADHQAVAVVAVTRDDMVVLTKEGDCASGDGLLTHVKVEESADLTLLVDADAALLEMADTSHFGVKGDLLGL